MAKKNNGKSLEKTIQLIQETFKDSENTQVFPSSKLVCESGIEREFDVLIKSKINGIDICIAIECKDYGKRVTIDRIDAFKGKCSTIKEINKMVFVSANGFQSGALIQAKKFGIDILTAEQISLDYIENIIPNISQFGLKVKEIKSNYRLTLGGNDLNLLQTFTNWKNDYILQHKSKKEFNIHKLIKSTIELSSEGFQGLALNHIVKFKNTIEENNLIRTNLALKIPEGQFYVENSDNQTADVTKIEFDIVLELKKLHFETSGRVIKNEDDSIKAHSVKFKISEDSESEVIVKPNNEISYYFTEKKETTQLKKLFVYDPATDKVISCKE